MLTIQAVQMVGFFAVLPLLIYLLFRFCNKIDTGPYEPLAIGLGVCGMLLCIFYVGMFINLVKVVTYYLRYSN